MRRIHNRIKRVTEILAPVVLGVALLSTEASAGITNTFTGTVNPTSSLDLKNIFKVAGGNLSNPGQTETSWSIWTDTGPMRHQALDVDLTSADVHFPKTASGSPNLVRRIPPMTFSDFGKNPGIFEDDYHHWDLTRDVTRAKPRSIPTPEPSTLAIWSVLGAGGWLGMRGCRQRRNAGKGPGKNKLGIVKQ